jgi:hypothetical protein
MIENREKIMKATPEERMKFAKELFDRIQREDKAKSNESAPADDARRPPVEPKPPASPAPPQ